MVKKLLLEWLTANPGQTLKRAICSGSVLFAWTYSVEVNMGVNYSITSMARIRMARLPWMIQTLFFSPYKILPIAQEFGIITDQVKVS